MQSTSLIEELKRNNDVPSDETIEEVKGMLRKPLKDLHDLRAEIQGLEQRLEELKARQSEAQAWIMSYQSILSLIRRLPTDILEEIFCHCLPTHRNPIIKTTECPMLLTQICSRWRAVALGDSRIWSRLYITFSDDDLIPVGDVDGIDPQSRTVTSTDRSKQRAIHMLRNRIDAVKEWISRSGSRPLSIALKFTCITGQPSAHFNRGSTNDITSEFFQFLASISTRFEDLELNMSIDMYSFLENMMVIPEMKMLKSIRADYRREASLFNRQESWDTHVGLLRAPNLQKIAMSGEWISIWRGSNPSQDWSQLTHLACHQSLSVSDLAQLLERSPNLIFFEAWIGEDSDNHLAQPHPFQRQISLPFLRSLHITENVYTPLTSKLYNVIDAPLLHCVSINAQFPVHHASENPPSISIIPLLSKSSALKKLIIDADDLSRWGVDGLFRAAAAVTHLVVGTSPKRWDLLPQSIWPRISSYMKINSSWTIGGLLVDRPPNVESDPPVLPNLESIDVSITNQYFSDEKLKDFVISRLDPSSQRIKSLKHVGVRFFREKEMDIEKEIKRHGEHVGVHIDLELDYPDVCDDLQVELRTFSPAYGLDPLGGWSWASPSFDDTSDETDLFPS